ncbi:MAG: SRPBCC family protein [Candidatus Limnocylindria bacterium]
MWRRVEIEAGIDHPPGRVYAYLADPARWHQFAPAVVQRRQIGDGPRVVGTKWAAIDSIGPFRIHFTDELIELDAERRVVWHSTTPWNSRVEYVCLPESGGTRVLARYEGDVAGWLRLVALLPTVILAKILQRDFKGLRATLAADTGAEGTDRAPFGQPLSDP